MSYKVVMIGLDGGTYRILKPLINEGKLPNIARLIQNGSHGTLLSTIPPVTAPAWTSLLTGKNPGKHGIFNFLKMVAKSYTTTFYDWKESSLVNAVDIPSKTIWELAGEGGRRVGMINLPMTYPPMPLNGFMISCMLTPPGSTRFTYPVNLKTEIPEYKIDVECGRGYGQVTSDYVKDYRRFFLDLSDVMDKRAMAILHLMKNKDWDLLMPVFTETDRMHHYYWRCMDPSDPFSETADGRAQKDLFINLYQRLDEHIGEIVQAAGDAAIMVVSDHGFTAGAKYNFHLNSWLRQNGYLLLEGDPVPERYGPGWTEFLSENFLSKYFSDFSAAGSHPQSSPPPSRGKDKGTAAVSWKQTLAWGIPYLARTGGIKINVRGEMEYGIVPRNNRYDRMINEIRNGLGEIRDSGGRLVMEKVYLRDEIYQGEYSSNAPDILFTVSDEYELPLNFQSDVNSKDVITTIKNPFLTGNHEQEGILIIAGGPVAEGRSLPDSRIESVAPTILHLLGLPVPEDMDGVVIMEALKSEYLESNPIRYCPSQLPHNRIVASGDTGGWESNEDMQEVKARLRGLGYMD